MNTVLAHGVWDVLHPGHLSLLKEAKSLGDELIVSVTSDRYVNKGPGKPVFGQRERMEHLLALSVVDKVVLSDHPTGAESLEAWHPNVYIKGAEYTYETLAVEERRVLEANGTRFHVASWVEGESSSKIRVFDTYSDETEAWLASFRQRHNAGSVLAALDSIKEMDLLIVGEHITDRYIFVDTLAKSPREHHMSTRKIKVEDYAGGVVAVRRHLKGMVASTTVATQREGIIKERFVEPNENRKLFSVQQIPEALTFSKEGYSLVENPEVYDAILVLDYGHGLIREWMRETLPQKAKFLAVNSQTNSANYGFNLASKWPHANYRCLDGPEYNLAKASGWRPSATEHLMLTKGKQGCSFYGDIPSLTVKVVDRVGAGDALFAVTAPLVAAGVEPEIVGFIGSCAAAMQCETVGNKTSINAGVLRKFIKRLLV